MSARLEGFGLLADRLDESCLEGMQAGRAAERYAPELTAEQTRRRMERSGEWDDHMLELAIREDGRAVGSMQARRCDRTMFPGNFEIGLNLFWEADRGRGVGRRAVALLTTYLFDHRAARRVQITTDVDNAAMRAVAERLGFTDEGTLRGFALTPEGPRDFELYAITRSDYEAMRWT